MRKKKNIREKYAIIKEKNLMFSKVSLNIAYFFNRSV